MENNPTEHSRGEPSIRFIILTFAASLLTVTTASAQAWALPKNTGIFGITYARATATRHLFSEDVAGPTGDFGRSIKFGEEYSNIAVVSGDYGITDRLSLSGDLSYVSSKYNGEPDWQEGELDDGSYHGTLTDFRFEFRYEAVRDGHFSFTPFIGGVIPTHQYQNEGHGAPGRGLRQIPVGFGLGYVWPKAVHTTYFQGRYAYSFLMHEGYDFARSNAFVEAGTYLAHWCAIRTIIGAEKTHGGIDWATGINTEEDFEVHDARTSSRYLSAAVGLLFNVSSVVQLAASYSEILGGSNVVNTHTYWVSASWTFGGAGEKIIGKRR